MLGKAVFKRLCALLVLVCLLADASMIVTYAADNEQEVADSTVAEDTSAEDAVLLAEDTSTTTKKLLNGSFEEGQTWVDSYKQPNQNDVPAWHTTAFQNKMELFRKNTGTYIKPNVVLEPTDGLYAAELNADEESTLYQNVFTTPVSIYEWGLDHGGRNGTDIMALVIGPRQSVDPSKPEKAGRDQFMQMVDWLNIDSATVLPGAEPQRYTVYSKKFAAAGTFEDNVGNNAFSLTPSTIYTERWEIWIMSSSNKNIDENNKLIWNSYGSNAEGEAGSGNESGSTDIDMNNYYLYTVPANQTETVFGFVSVGYLESTASADKAKTYGNFLDNIHFQIYHPLSSSTTNHGSAIIGGSDGSVEGEGETTGHEVTVDGKLQTYVTDGQPLKVQAIIKSENITDCDFAGVYYTKQNEDGVPTTVFLPKIDSQNVIEDTGSLTEEEKKDKWIKSTNENGDTIYTYYIEAITSATDMHFVFIKSPMITYDPNGGLPYAVGERIHDDEAENVYSFRPVRNDGAEVPYTFIPPYVSHAAEGQNDGWKFMGWKVTGDFIEIPEGSDIQTVNADKLGELIIPAVHTVACNYSFVSAMGSDAAQYFKFMDGDVALTEHIHYSSDEFTVDGVRWDDNGEEILYANEHKGMTMVAQWRWRQAFIPQSSNDVALGFDDDDRGGRVEIVASIDDFAENYNDSYTENGGKSYHAETDEWITVNAIPNTGYEFVGWYTEDENGELVLVSTEPTYKYVETKESVKTYYARFFGSIRQEYIRQVWNDVSGEWEDTFDDAIGILGRYEYVDAPLKPISSTAAAGEEHYFVGWYDADGNAVPGDMLINGGKTLSYITVEDAVYYARFKAYNVTINQDKIVIDYGLPVQIHVLANDTAPAEATLTLAGVSAAIPKDMSPTASLSSGFATSMTGTYGRADLSKDTVTYTKTGMEMNAPERFAYAVKYKNSIGVVRYYYSTVTVIPAATIYYEDDFVAFDGGWNTVGTRQSANQSEDRLGDADNAYGYDSAYAACKTYSMGAAKKTTVSSQTYTDNGKWPTATFTFTGEGFDLISLTGNKTGFIFCRVYEGTQTDTVYQSWVMDTYYGYTRTIDEEAPWLKYTWTYNGDRWSVVKEAVTDEEKLADTSGLPLEPPENPQQGDQFVQYKVNYIWTPTSTGTDNSLYQIPVIKSPELTYGTYTVVVTPTYIPFFDHTKEGSYDFYLDAVRVYNPAQNMDNDYVLDRECWPQYIELRDQLLTRDEAGNSSAYVSGASFVDGGCNENVSDYENYGPNNEIYLNPHQAVAFAVQSNGSSIASVQVGIKSFGEAGTLTASCVDADGNTLVTGNLQINTRTEMYYSLTNLNGSSCLQWQDGGAVSQAIVLTNSGDTPITLTSLKITYAQKPAAEAELCMNLELMQAAAESVVRRFMGIHVPEVTEPLYIPDENLKFSTSISIGAETQVVFTILADKVSAYDERFYLEVVKDVAGGEPVTRTYGFGEGDIVFSEITQPTTGELLGYAATFTGVNAKELGDMFHATLYAVDDDGNLHYSSTYASSIKDYAMSLMASNPEAVDVCVALLNYGAAAQAYFHYDVENPVNADLTEAQKAIVVPEVSADWSIRGSGTSVVSPAVSLRSKVNIAVTFILRDSELLHPSDSSDFVMVVTDENGNEVARVSATVVKETSSMLGLTATYDELRPADMRTTYSFTLYKGDAVVSKTLTWSVEAYVMECRGSAKEVLADAMLAFGDAAASYLGVGNDVEDEFTSTVSSAQFCNATGVAS